MDALRGSPGPGAMSRTTRQDDAMAGVRHGSALFYAADACCWWGPGGGLAVTRQEFWIPESFDFSVPSHTAVVSGGNMSDCAVFHAVLPRMIGGERRRAQQYCAENGPAGIIRSLVNVYRDALHHHLSGKVLKYAIGESCPPNKNIEVVCYKARTLIPCSVSSFAGRAAPTG